MLLQHSDSSGFSFKEHGFTCSGSLAKFVGLGFVFLLLWPGGGWKDRMRDNREGQ